MRSEPVPVKCPQCDGAMVMKPVRRCVRCGPPKPKEETFAEIIERGVIPRFDDRKNPHSIYFGRMPQWDYYLTVGEAGIIFRIKQPPLATLDAGKTILIPVDHKTPVGDKDYWAGIRSSIFGLMPERYSRFTSWMWDRVKERRMWAQRKSWRDVLPDDIVEWADRTLDEASKEDDCVDNYRVARVGNSSQQRRYKRQKNSGCCGFSDFIEEGPDGNRYMLGFNYGH